MPEDSSSIKSIMTWIGYVSAVLGLLATLYSGVRWFSERNHQSSAIQSEMALAETQTQQAEYEAAVHTYQDILQKDPQNRNASDKELNAAMLWVENFSVEVPDGQDQKAADIAAPKLDQIFTLLDAASARVHGPQAANVLAHLGWAHFLNSYTKVGGRESTRAAKEGLEAALTLDPSNAYANSMLGNMLLQTGGSTQESVGYFAAAIASGKQRPFVRTMQLPVLVDMNRAGARPELVKIADEMRKDGEPLDEDTRRGIARFLYDSIVGSHEEMTALLTAVPPEDALPTYDWLHDQEGGPDRQKLMRQFLSASLLETTGKRDEALIQFRALQQDLKGQPEQAFNYTYPVEQAIKRLTMESGRPANPAKAHSLGGLPIKSQGSPA